MAEPLASSQRIEADYLIETAYDPRAAIETMAGEQSSGTFVPVPGEAPELKERSAARIEAIEILGETEAPSLPGAGRPAGSRIQRARATLSWPLANMALRCPTLWRPLAATSSSSSSSRVCAFSTCACRRRSPTPIPARNSASGVRAGWRRLKVGR